ncbi:single-stranded-DNA-specific exonuclease RecJ [uncultured Acetobacteroides sp.]|uniref:single-stranded-DNA-specific exonuclease RecJ n=1 Tax=uncultured Acetobacteroides sp. TaxID=1760811 RepID=UPI0029F4B6A8|nr:single-stranded-DNA-specific exonuclease RecJ [uncultured Acetobacteroides sp.]
MVKSWVLKEQGNPEIVVNLAASLGIDSVLANLLVQRGVTNFDDAKAFFRPSLSDLHDPFLLADMDKAVERLHSAMFNNERILVYGDYDVDGTTAVALMYSFLRERYPNVSYYIPDRYSEGYGVSFKSIEYAAQNGYTLFITLDCGIKAVEKVAHAKTLGIDFVICDHHFPSEVIPDAVAVLDPKRIDCSYPFGDLSGCGVGFKLLQAYCLKYNIPFSELEVLLDLVAVSIASDIVPVIGENRVLAYFGLKRLNEKPRYGLKSIIKLSGLDHHSIAIDDIVFKIGPRINAAGRMESGKTAVDLLTAPNEEVAKEIADIINECNNDRKNVDRTITLDAFNFIESNPEFAKRKSTVLFNPTWHKGVVGIVASRLIETYYRPTVVLTLSSNGFATGSARSVPGFDLYQAVETCSDLLENFGGHMYAAGLTLKVENVEKFSKRFEEVVSAIIKPEMLVPQIEIDSKLNLEEISPKFYRILKQFQPFGPGNMSPVFLTEEVYDNGDGRKVGTGEEHLKLDLIQENNPYKPIGAIGFGLANHYDNIKNGMALKVCYAIVENHFRGVSTIQLRLKDVKLQSEPL